MARTARSSLRGLRMLLLTPLLLVGCGPAAAPEPSPGEGQAEQPLSCVDSCPEGYCEVYSRYVDCGPGRPSGYSSMETCHGTYCATWNVCGSQGPFCPI